VEKGEEEREKKKARRPRRATADRRACTETVLVSRAVLRVVVGCQSSEHESSTLLADAIDEGAGVLRRFDGGKKKKKSNESCCTSA